MVDFLTTARAAKPKNTKRSRRIASPWILGLYALAGATFILGTRMAGWYSAPDSQFFLFPFSAALGGIALLAGMWAFEASEGLATVMLTIWGSFWVAYALLMALFLSGKLSEPAERFPQLGIWFIVLAAITWVGAGAALVESSALALTLGFLAGGSTLAAIAKLAGFAGPGMVAGWLFIISALIGWYTATAMLLDAMVGHSVLPLGDNADTTQPMGSERVGEPGSVPGPTPASRRIG